MDTVSATIDKEAPLFRVPSSSEEVPLDILRKIHELAGAIVMAQHEEQPRQRIPLFGGAWRRMAEQEIMIITGAKDGYSRYLWYADNLFKDAGASARLCSPNEERACKQAISELDFDVIWHAINKEPLKILSARSEEVYCSPISPTDFEREAAGRRATTPAISIEPSRLNQSLGLAS